MPDQMFACPQCGSRTSIIRTTAPVDEFGVSSLGAIRSWRATLVKCANEVDCGYAWEVRPVTPAAEAAVAQLDADLQVVLAITDENLRAQARAEAEQRFLTTAAAGDESA